MIVITPVETALSGRYLSLLFNSPTMRREFDAIRSGSTVPHLTCREVKEMLVPLPNLSAQLRVVEQAEKMSVEASRLTCIYERKLAALGALKKSLLHQAFSGQWADEVRVRPIEWRGARLRRLLMKTIEHKVIVHGPAVRESGLVPSGAGAVLLRLENGLRGAVDVAFRRSSTSGRRQPWLRKAGEVEFKDVQRTGKEEAALYFSAKPFGEVAQDYYAQPRLFDDGPSAEDTAFDVFNDAVGDVMAKKADSDKYDVGLLKRFRKFESTVFSRDVHELLISGHRVPPNKPRRLSEEFPKRAEALYLETPEPSRVRIAGRLDMIEASTMAFALVLPGGDKVRGVWKGNDFETLRRLVDSDVAASGLAVFRPSGTLLRIDADALAPQRDADRFFAMVPVPTGGKLDLRSLLREQHARGGMASLGGKIPAEESDEEFLAAIAEMD